jgi:hypothetical protein
MRAVVRRIRIFLLGLSAGDQDSPDAPIYTAAGRQVAVKRFTGEERIRRIELRSGLGTLISPNRAPHEKFIVQAA